MSIFKGNNPYELTALILFFSLLAIAFFSVFSGVANAKMSPFKLVAPKMYCGSYTEPDDLEGFLSFIRSKDHIEVLHEEIPYKEFGGKIEVLYNAKGLQTFNEITWDNSVICERVKQTVKKGTKQES